MSVGKQLAGALRVLCYLSFLGVFVLGGLAQCNTSPGPSQAGGPPTAPHTGLLYYSERNGVPGQGGLYLYDLASGAEVRLSLESDLITSWTGFDWSPAASRLVYAAGTGVGAEIYVVDATGAHRQRLTYNDLEESSPVWSPDGAHISFAGRDVTGDQAQRAYLMRADGSDVHLLFDDPDIAGPPALWSPDGKYMAASISHRANQAEYTLLILDAATEEEVIRIDKGEAYLPYKWSPDSSQLAFVAMGRLGRFLDVVDLSTGRRTELLETSEMHTIDWFPATHKVVFSEENAGVYRMFVSQDDGTERDELAGTLAYAALPQWSPDGTMVAFSGADSVDRSPEIYYVDIETRNVVRITYNEFADIAPIWISW